MKRKESDRRLEVAQKRVNNRSIRIAPEVIPGFGMKAIPGSVIHTIRSHTTDPHWTSFGDE